MLFAAYNWLSSKSLRCLRLTIRFPQKVSAVYGLQFALLENVALSTAYNQLTSKSLRCLRFTIILPVEGLRDR